MEFRDAIRKWYMNQEIDSSIGNDLRQILARYVADWDATEFIETAKANNSDVAKKLENHISILDACRKAYKNDPTIKKVATPADVIRRIAAAKKRNITYPS